MSRSRRYTPICGIAAGADSEKKDKQIVNRRLRRINAQALALCLDEFQATEKQEIHEVWEMPKDGKFFFDSQEYPELMRK